MGLLHHNDSPLGAPAAPAWGGRGAQHACKQPARMVPGACKECARGVQAACKNCARSVQGVCKEPTRTVRGVARNMQEVHKEHARSKELGQSVQGVCNKRASRPPGPQTESKGCHRSMCTCRTAGWGRGRDRQDRQTAFLRAQEQACRRVHSLHQQGTVIGGKKK